jgi:hypothetical protein
MAHQHLITPSPQPWTLDKRQDLSSVKKSFIYPACRDDSSGPCKLQTSSSDACQREFPEVTSLYARWYCSCTNGYYDRSSECRNDCYRASRTSVDSVSISRESKMVSLSCEINLLAMESDAAFYSSLALISMSLSSEAENRKNSTTQSIGFGVATLGATDNGVASETRKWADRPTPTGQPQQRGGASSGKHASYKGLLSITVALALYSFFHCS